ncbi:MAG: AmmeMemoRadiSam system protein A [Erysipelotrichaceae bacterium]
MSILGAFVLPHPPIVLHEIGHGEEEKIQSTIDGFKKVAQAIAALKPDTIVLSSPHAPAYRDAFFVSECGKVSGNFARFNAKQVAISAATDLAFVAELKKRNPDFAGSKLDADDLDHGTMVPLYFIQQALPSFRLVRIGLSFLDDEKHIAIGKTIRETAEALGRRTVFIASGDLSHRLTKEGPYGFAQEGPVFDKTITDILASGKLSKLTSISPDLMEKAAECGYRSLLILSGVIGELNFVPELYSYEGPFGVGYATAAFLPMKAVQKDRYVRLARLAVENFVLKGVEIDLPPDTPAELTQFQAGVFVSLHRQHRLRGCIGTIFPVTSCVGEEILRNAVFACSQDPRFAPVGKNELADLDIGVDVLGAPEEINYKSQLDVKRYGVIVAKGRRKGLLLPDLDGVDSVDQQIQIALQKAGIEPDEEYTLQRFEVVRHHD